MKSLVTFYQDDDPADSAEPGDVWITKSSPNILRVRRLDNTWRAFSSGNFGDPPNRPDALRNAYPTTELGRGRTGTAAEYTMPDKSPYVEFGSAIWKDSTGQLYVVLPPLAPPPPLRDAFYTADSVPPYAACTLAQRTANAFYAKDDGTIEFVGLGGLEIDAGYKWAPG